jgi:activator of 2-hydroxyglutaryl-CoA dehydratase
MLPWQGETNTVETWAESMNAAGLTPNSHCTIVDCGGTNSKFG